MNQRRNHHEAGNKLHAGILLGLIFDPEDGGYMFLRNVGWLSTGKTVLYLRTSNGTKIANDKLETIWMEVIRPVLKFYPSIFLKVNVKKVKSSLYLSN
jgi:hypothetical protein